MGWLLKSLSDIQYRTLELKCCDQTQVFCNRGGFRGNPGRVNPVCPGNYGVTPHDDPLRRHDNGSGPGNRNYVAAHALFDALFLSGIRQISVRATIVYDVELDGTVIKINHNYLTVAMEIGTVTMERSHFL